MGEIMATKSMLKSVDVRDKYLGRNLISALENAEKKGAKSVTFSKSVKTVRKDKIKALFGE